MNLAVDPLATGKSAAEDEPTSGAADAARPATSETAVTGPRSGDVLVRNISVLTVGQVLTWSLTLVWMVVVPRRLGSSQVGIFTLGAAVTGMLMVIVGLGMRPLLVREIAADASRAPRLIGAAVVLRAIFSVPALAVALLLVTVGPFHGDEAAAILLGWATCLFAVVFEPVAAGFQAIEKMHFLAYATVLGKLVGTVTGIALVMVGVRAVGLLVMGVVVWALVGGLTVVWARPYFRIVLRVTRRELRSLFVQSLPYWGFVAFFTIYLWIDSLMLAAMTTSTVLGWYGLPTQLFGTLMFVPTILSTAWLSRLVRAHQGGMDTLLRAARPAIEMSLVLSMPVCVGAVLVSDHLVATLYGPGFAPSGPIFALLACCVPPMYLNIMANQVMVARNQQVVWTKMMALASVINPLLNLVLIPYFQRTHGDGAIGASIAMIVTELVLAVIGIILVRDVFTRQTVVRVLKGAAATAGMAVVVLFGLRAGLVVGVISGMVSFPLFAMAARVLSGDERTYLRDLVSGMFRELGSRRSGRAPAAARGAGSTDAEKGSMV